MPTTRFGTAVLVGLVLSLASLHAADEKKAEDRKTAEQKDVKAPAAGTKKTIAPTQSHVVVTKDPVTGKLRQATPEEAAALNKQHPSASKTAPKMIEGPGGAVGMILDDSPVPAVGAKGSDKKTPQQKAKTNDK